MPKIYYNETSYFKREKFKKSKRPLFIILGLVFFAFIIFSASLVTNTISVGSFSFGISSSKNNKYAFKYYLLCLGRYETFGEAENVSITSILLGASGFVWEDDSKYYVLGSAYDSLNDAKSVQNNFNETEFKTEILTVKIDFSKVLSEKFEKENMDRIKKTIVFLKSLCNSLIDNSIKLDKKEISYIIASNNLNNLKSDLIEHINNFEYFLDNTNENVIKLKNCVLKIENLLDKTINSLIQNDNVNYNLKNCLCSVIRCCYEVNI